MVATLSVGGLFVGQALILVALGVALEPDGASYFPPTAYWLTTAISAVVAALLAWKSTGNRRAVALGAATTAGSWLLWTILAVLFLHGAGVA